MAAAQKVYITPEEYFARERDATEKSEYFAGEIVAMAGGSRWHSLIAANIIGEIRTRLRPTPCQTYSSDLHVQAAGAFYYPDVTVVCGEPQVSATNKDAVTNSLVIVEVLSPSTENRDRGVKFAYYRQIETLRDYVLVSQNEMLVEHFARQTDGRWLMTELRGPESVLRLTGVVCDVPLAEIYARVEFGQEAA